MSPSNAQSITLTSTLADLPPKLTVIVAEAELPEPVPMMIRSNASALVLTITFQPRSSPDPSRVATVHSVAHAPMAVLGSTIA